ncbi:hypothetical protein [Natroniella sp. ANB-PHB2]|uniref:hypothetical protein n=1 Tax=Natroniella sp. ANB-PHB2 TaxID=3384444 RepID=UPI0038D4FEEC
MESKGGLPVELFPLDLDKASPVADQKKFISHYEYNVWGRVERLEFEDVIHGIFTDSVNSFSASVLLSAALNEPELF